MLHCFLHTGPDSFCRRLVGRLAAIGSLCLAWLPGICESQALAMPPDSSARPLKTCVDSLLRHGRTVYYTVRGHAAWVRQRPVVQKFGVPVLLIGTGAIIRNEVELFELEMEIDESVRDGAQRHLYGVRTNIDDYLRHVPAYATLGLSVAGVKGSNKILDQALLLGLIYQVNSGITSHLKRWTQVERPNGQNQRSFPSSHTSTAFATAHFMHKEYGHRSAWYSVGAYAMATSTAALRVAKDNHWTSDVVAGAGVGILSTELAYWAYPALKRTAQRLGQHLGRKPKQQASGGTQVLVSPYYAQGAVGACLMVGLR